jgi:hypothetical protein
MPDNIIPFPSSRRHAFVRRHAAIMVSLSRSSAERHLRRQLRVQSDAFARRGIAEALIARERRELERAIRSEVCRLLAAGAA